MPWHESEDPVVRDRQKKLRKLDQAEEYRRLNSEEIQQARKWSWNLAILILLAGLLPVPIFTILASMTGQWSCSDCPYPWTLEWSLMEVLGSPRFFVMALLYFFPFFLLVSRAYFVLRKVETGLFYRRWFTYAGICLALTLVTLPLVYSFFPDLVLPITQYARDESWSNVVFALFYPGALVYSVLMGTVIGRLVGNVIVKDYLKEKHGLENAGRDVLVASILTVFLVVSALGLINL